MTSLTLSATDFKATCLELMDRASAGAIDMVTITKRGRPHVTIRFGNPAAPAVDPFGCMQDWPSLLPADHDWSVPLVSEAELDAMIDDLDRQIRGE
jgi:hypothetical protein